MVRQRGWCWEGGWCAVLVLALLYSGLAQAACSLPANWPSGVTGSCQCDDFGRSSLNPSTIYSSNWTATTSDSTGIVPRIVNQGYLRLTDNTVNNAKAATVPGVFPAAGNYISIEFRHYAYNGNGGADGVAMILSDYAVPAVPGGYGGSLGYAQRTDTGLPGFAGGWLGIGFDEYGNFQNPTEGRVGGVGYYPQSIGMRGSGAGSSGYPWLYGSYSLSGSNTIDNRGSTSPSRGYAYQIIVDARSYTSTNQVAYVAINRDVSGSETSYSAFFPSFDVYSRARAMGVSQASVPDNWQISFTASTGAYTNIHEIGGLRICAMSMMAPGGGTPGGFNAIDSSYTLGDVTALQGHVFTKLAGIPFSLKVAALNSTSSGIATTYALTSTKNVTVSLIDDSSGTSCNVSASACTACNKPVIASQNLSFKSTDKGSKLTSNFTVAKAYSRVLVRINDSSTTGCSTDVFAIRPTAVSAVSSSATNAGLTGSPVFKAGTDAFTLSASVPVGGYTGTLKVAAKGIQGLPGGAVAGSLGSSSFAPAVAGVSSSSASLSTTYSEAGNFRILGSGGIYGIYDDSWTAVDQGATNDCVAGSYSNTLDASGKYGCLFGLTSDSATFGRFSPSRFVLASSSVQPACSASGKTAFTYMGQPLARLALTLQAQNGAGAVLANYDSTLLGSLASISWTAENADNGQNLGSRLSIPSPARVWNAGQYLLDTAAASFLRATSPDGSYEALQLGVQLSDPDGAALTSLDINPLTSGACTPNTCTARAVGSPLALRFGRLRLQNAFGWEQAPLRIPLQAEYWKGSDFVPNADDSCTTLSPSNFVFTTATGAPTNCATGLSLSNNGQFTNGSAQAILAAPGSPLSLWISPDLDSTAGGKTCVGTRLPVSLSNATAASKTWLQGRWQGGTTYTSNPRSKAVFGLHRGADKVIQVREVY